MGLQELFRQTTRRAFSDSSGRQCPSIFESKHACRKYAATPSLFTAAIQPSRRIDSTGGRAIRQTSSTVKQENPNVSDRSTHVELHIACFFMGSAVTIAAAET